MLYNHTTGISQSIGQGNGVASDFLIIFIQRRCAVVDKSKSKSEVGRVACTDCKQQQRLQPVNAFLVGRKHRSIPTTHIFTIRKGANLLTWEASLIHTMYRNTCIVHRLRIMLTPTLPDGLGWHTVAYRITHSRTTAQLAIACLLHIIRASYTQIARALDHQYQLLVSLRLKLFSRKALILTLTEQTLVAARLALRPPMIQNLAEWVRKKAACPQSKPVPKARNNGVRSPQPSTKDIIRKRAKWRRLRRMLMQEDITGKTGRSSLFGTNLNPT